MALGCGLVLSILWPASPAVASWNQVGSDVARTQRELAVNDLKRIGATEYVAWTASNGHNEVVRVARFDRARGSWTRVGRAVNHARRRDARCAALAAGPSGVPWIAWAEVDRGGVSQIRVAHWEAATSRWVEPDGRDWAINDRPPIWSAFYRDDGQGGRAFGSSCPSIALLGGRPYVGYANYAGSGESAPRVARLGRDGHTWRELAGRSEPPLGQGFLGMQLAVVAAKLTAAISWGAQQLASGDAWRLTAQGEWRQRGCLSCVPHEPGSELHVPGTVAAPTEQDGYPTVIRNTEPDDPDHSDRAYVLRLTDGGWHLLGGGPLGPRSDAGALRVAGGRLYAGWWSRTGYDPGPEHVSRLADDGSAWDALPDPGPFRLLRLSALDGAPYVAGVMRSGAAQVLRVERLGGVPSPVGPDDDEGSGPGPDPKARTVRVLPPVGPCGIEYEGTDYRDDMDFSGYRRRFSVRGRAGDDRIRGGERGDCLHGGRGDDRIDSADGHVDRVYCGAGDDTVTADRLDRLHDCEHVRYVAVG